MNDVIQHIKKINGYTETTPNCATCSFFKDDPSTDNFGRGDYCNRNPDITFNVRPSAVCKKWTTTIKT